MVELRESIKWGKEITPLGVMKWTAGVEVVNANEKVQRVNKWTKGERMG